MTKLPQMDVPEPPAPITPPPPPVKQPGKMRTYISVAVLVAILAVVLYAVRNSQDAGKLAVGTCFDVPTSSDFSTVEKVDCTAPHDAEVIFTGEWSSGDTYPIQSAIDDYLTASCFPAFESYVGEPFLTSTTYDMSYFKPTTDAWNDGERTFTCYAHDPNDAKLSKSVKGAAGAPAAS